MKYLLTKEYLNLRETIFIYHSVEILCWILLLFAICNVSFTVCPFIFCDLLFNVTGATDKCKCLMVQPVVLGLKRYLKQDISGDLA